MMAAVYFSLMSIIIIIYTLAVVVKDVYSYFNKYLVCEYYNALKDVLIITFLTMIACSPIHYYTATNCTDLAIPGLIPVIAILLCTQILCANDSILNSRKAHTSLKVDYSKWYIGYDFIQYTLKMLILFNAAMYIKILLFVYT